MVVFHRPACQRTENNCFAVRSLILIWIPCAKPSHKTIQSGTPCAPAVENCRSCRTTVDNRAYHHLSQNATIPDWWGEGDLSIPIDQAGSSSPSGRAACFFLYIQGPMALVFPRFGTTRQSSFECPLIFT